MIPDWKLERYRLGELSAEDQAQVARAAADDAAVRARLATLEESDRAIRGQYPALPARRPQAPREERPAFFWLAPGLVAVAALLLAVVFWPRALPDDVLTPKGDPALRIFRLAGEGQPERLPDGAHVKPHDVVQVAFDLQGGKHLVVASVDGAGHATLHWPLDGGTRVPDGLKALPRSFELDDAPGFERFFLVVSDSPLSTEAVLDAARRAGSSAPLSLGGRVAVRSLLLDKESP